MLPTPNKAHLFLCLSPSLALPLLLSNHNPLAAPLKFFCPIWEECYPRGKTEWSHNRAFSNRTRLLLLRVAEECHPPLSTTMSSSSLVFALNVCLYVCAYMYYSYTRRRVVNENICLFCTDLIFIHLYKIKNTSWLDHTSFTLFNIEWIQCRTM